MAWGPKSRKKRAIRSRAKGRILGALGAHHLYARLTWPERKIADQYRYLRDHRRNITEADKYLASVFGA